MRFSVLGPLQVLDDEGSTVDLGGRQPRLMLAVLLVADGRSVSVDALIDALWGDEPPASATGTLQSYVSRLRRRLGDRRDAGARRRRLPPRRRPGGRRPPPVRGPRRRGPGRCSTPATPTSAHARLVEAEALWRGPALVEFADVEFAAGAAARLEERRLAALEDRLDADLALGRHASVVGELAELVGGHPLREGLRAPARPRPLPLGPPGRGAARPRRRRPHPPRGARHRARPRRCATSRRRSSPTTRRSTSRRHRRPRPPARHRAGRPRPSRRGPSGRRSPRPTSVGRDARARRPASPPSTRPAGDARFVVVEGEPGIGKTRLAEELRRRIAADGGASLAVWGRSDEGGAAPALWPWLAPLRDARRRTASRCPAALAELLAGDGARCAPGQAQRRPVRAVRGASPTLLERRRAATPARGRPARRPPVGRRRVARAARLPRRPPRRGVLVVGTVRQLEVGRNDAVTDALAAIARRPGSRRLAPPRPRRRAATAAVLEAAADDASTPAAAERDPRTGPRATPSTPSSWPACSTRRAASREVPGTRARRRPPPPGRGCPGRPSTCSASPR